MVAELPGKTHGKHENVSPDLMSSLAMNLVKLIWFPADRLIMRSICNLRLAGSLVYKFQER